MEVTNNNFLSVTIYALTGSNAIRIGDVGGKSSARFELDQGRLGLEQGIQIRVNPVGSNQRYVSPMVYADRGTTVFLQVAAELSLSYVSVR